MKTCERPVQQNKALFDVGIDTAAWEVSRDEIVPFLRNAALHRRIAFHFSRLNSLAHLCSLYLDMVAGIASALGGVEHTRDALRNYLIATSTEMIAQTNTLCAEIETLLKVPKSSKNMGTLPRLFRRKPGFP